MATNTNYNAYNCENNHVFLEKENLCSQDGGIYGVWGRDDWSDARCKIWELLF